ncbi:Phage tail assembly chaperone protein [uncultured Caudovirales phage]|uniref:Phage tail assembly chaperone protein n=1 Tax=uncultured Caudovirales phage TaxID=2100421 RepID=A0A6J7WGB0_9CAUD|nr:Phage tail assembly chaperone protein [uncultured Caudovirales phage]
MNYFLHFNSNGRIFAQDIDGSNYPDSMSLNIGTNPIDITKNFIQDNQVALLPDKPNDNNYWEFDYENKVWIGDAVIASSQALAKRLTLLEQSDWTQIPNNPLATEQQTAWATYRQELRDITAQSGYPFNVIWPTPPT